MHDAAMYSDTGETVTAVAKCASKRLRLPLCMLDKVATRMGIVWEKNRKTEGVTSSDHTKRNAIGMEMQSARTPFKARSESADEVGYLSRCLS
jgi:hypothetical protein